MRSGYDFLLKLLLLAALVALALPSLASSQVIYTWTGAVDGDWSDSGNWSSTENDAPNDNDDFALFAASGALTTVVLDQNRTIGQVTFNSADSYTLSGSNRTLTFSAPTGQSFASVVSAQGAHEISSRMFLNSQLNAVNNSAGDLTLSGQISGFGAGVFRKQGTGTVVLSGNNNFQGAVHVDEGILSLGSNNATGATWTNNNTVSAGGTLQLGGGINSDEGAWTVAGDGSTGSNGAISSTSGTNTLRARINLSDDASIVAESGKLILNDAIDGNPNGSTPQHELTLTGDGEIEVKGQVNDLETLHVEGGGKRSFLGQITNTSIDSGGSGAREFKGQIVNAGSISVDGGGPATFDRSVGTGTLTVDGGGESQFKQQVNVSTTADLDGDGEITFDAALKVQNLTVNGAGDRTFKGAVEQINGNQPSSISLDGAGNHVIQGQVNTQSLSINGTGDRTLQGQVNQVTSVQIDGSGETVFKANINGSGTADITVDGTGDRTFEGDVLTKSLTTKGSGNQTYQGQITGQSLEINGTGTRDFQGNVNQTGAIVDNNAGAVSFSGQIQGSAGYTKNGAGTTTFTGSGNNDINGDVTVNNGNLLLAKTSGYAVTNSSNIVINEGGTMTLGADDQFDFPGSFTLNGGTFFANGFSDDIGSTLKVTADSTFDFGITNSQSGFSIINFLDSKGEEWTGGLTILNWDGLLDGGGQDQLYFGNVALDLTPEQLEMVTFVDPFNLAPGTYSATILNDGEVVPGSLVPEPSSAALLLLAAAAGAAYRRRRPGRN